MTMGNHICSSSAHLLHLSELRYCKQSIKINAKKPVWVGKARLLLSYNDRPWTKVCRINTLLRWLVEAENSITCSPTPEDQKYCQLLKVLLQSLFLMYSWIATRICPLTEGERGAERRYCLFRPQIERYSSCQFDLKMNWNDWRGWTHSSDCSLEPHELFGKQQRHFPFHGVLLTRVAASATFHQMPS